MRTAMSHGRSVSVSAVAVVAVAGAVAGATACGAKNDERPPVEAAHRTPPSAEVAELEIRGVGVDRFVACPPPGELGQQWIPPLAPWTPPPAPDGGAPPAVDEAFIARTKDRTLTELAVEATHREFRSCYRRALVRHPTQEGRVAIVLRIGPDGRVVKVEEYAACGIEPESLGCMKSVASRLRFPPPAAGSETVTIPAVFTSRDGMSKTVASPNDAYTAAAFVTVETARPALHACEDQARRELRPLQATGTFTLSVSSDGRVTGAHVDPFTGEHSLLVCAARALEQLRFAPPPGGKGIVVARLNFNPRQGTR